MSTPERLCKFPECGRDHHAKGFCRAHYYQQHRGEQLRRLRQDTSTMDRLARSSRTEGDCLVWKGSLSQDGYGQVKWEGRAWRAHRVAYVLEHGPIPEGMQINHSCGNRACIELAHLELVTHQQNGEYRTRLPRSNTTGYRGVILNTRTGRYSAQVGASGVTHHLGYYATAEEAAQAAAEGRARLHSMPDFGARSVMREATR